MPPCGNQGSLGWCMLELRNITKRFPGVKALDNVSLAFDKGQIHALVGENGAGKSTAMNILAGNLQPDEGSILLEGKEVRLRSYQDAIRNDIGLVYQEIQVIPESTIAENIMLDKLKSFSKNGFLNWKRINEETERYLHIVGLGISPRTPIFGLSAAEKQLTQIAKALASNTRYLLLDEPTSSLTKHEVENLFALIKALHGQSVTVIFVSHKIEEVLQLCDKVSVLRDGKFVGAAQCDGLTKQEVVRMMIGRETSDVYLGRLDSEEGKKALEVRNLCLSGRFDAVNLHLNKGEILGFYGLVGSGRTELAKTIIGEYPMTSGEVFVNGVRAHIRGVKDSLYKYKMGYVTENRKEEGLILDFPIRDNVTITIWSLLRRAVTRFLSGKRINQKTLEYVESLSIRAQNIKQVAGSLSGGNQQKVSISKWLAADCDILFIDEPTRGVDVGAKRQIHELIWKIAKEGKKSIVLISSDMPEIVTLARRILVFRENRIVAQLEDLDRFMGNYTSVSEEIGKHLQ